MPDTDPSNERLEDLEAAFDEIESTDEETISNPEPEPSDSTSDEAVEPEPVADAGTDEPAEEPEPDTAENAEEAEAPEPEKKDVGRAPVSWKPEAREAWASIPAEARAEIERREKEVTNTLNETAGARRFTDEFGKMVQPYMTFIAAEGSNPMQAANYLFQTAAGLRVGTPQQKAAIVHEMISTFGVDVGMLDRLLVGEDAGPASPEDIQAMVDQRVAMAQNTQAAQPTGPTQQDVQAANTAIEQFASDPKNEFFHDVKDSMAMFLSDAAQRQQTMTLQEAYDLAVSTRPDLQGIISNRTDNTTSRAERRRRAASSVKPGGVTGNEAAPKGGGTITDDINRAWDMASGSE